MGVFSINTISGKQSVSGIHPPQFMEGRLLEARSYATFNQSRLGQSHTGMRSPSGSQHFDRSLLAKSQRSETLLNHNDEENISQSRPLPDKVRYPDVDVQSLKHQLIPINFLFDGIGGGARTPSDFVGEAQNTDWIKRIQDPGQPGPFAVRQYSVELKPANTGRTVNAMVMAPSQEQKQSPSPVILVSPPGFVGELKLPFNQRFFDMQPYMGFLSHFASMGFVAVGLFEHRGIVFENLDLVNHKQDAEELKAITDQLLSDETPIQERIITDRIAVMGHSKGGKMGFFQAAIDSRVALVLAIDPVNQGGPPWFVSSKFKDNPVAPVPEITPSGQSSLMDSVSAKAVIFRAPSDFINCDKRFNAEHFWHAFKGAGVYVDCDAKHGDWLYRKDLRQLTKRVFTAALMDVFREDKPFKNELRACEILGKNPNLVTNVEKRT